MTNWVELSSETLMRLSNSDLERCYQLILSRITLYDLAVERYHKGLPKASPPNQEYRDYLSRQSTLILNELIRRRWLIR